MFQRGYGSIKPERFINVRKAVALDMALRGPRFVLMTLAPAIPFAVAASAFMFFGPVHAPLTVAEGCFFLSVAINYVPILLYAISIQRHGSASQEVAFELEQKEIYLPRYGRQKVAFLLIPLAMLALAMYQEWQKRSLR